MKTSDSFLIFLIPIPPPFALSLSKGPVHPSTLLRTNGSVGEAPPFTLSLSKGAVHPSTLLRTNGSAGEAPPFTLSLSKGAPQSRSP